MRSVSEEVKERVRRGAALLDDKEPGWRDRISPAELDMRNCSMCVVGQVAEVESGFRYNDTLVHWGIWDVEDEYGFLPSGSATSRWDALRDAWIGFIKEEWS